MRAGDLIGRRHRRSAIRYQRLIARLEHEPLPEPEPSAAVARDEQARRRIEAQARAVMAALDPRHRIVLELAEFERCGGQEIARRLGITHQAARLRLMRARRAFGREHARRFGEGVGDDRSGR